MGWNILLLSCGAIGGFLLGFILAMEIGRKIHNDKMEEIRRAADTLSEDFETFAKGYGQN